MNNFVIKNTEMVKGLNNQYKITYIFDQCKPYYEKQKTGRKGKKVNE